MCCVEDCEPEGTRSFAFSLALQHGVLHVNIIQHTATRKWEVNKHSRVCLLLIYQERAGVVDEWQEGISFVATRLFLYNSLLVNLHNFHHYFHDKAEWEKRASGEMEVFHSASMNRFHQLVKLFYHDNCHCLLSFMFRVLRRFHREKE